MKKKILACILALILAACFVSCADKGEEAPDGMTSTTMPNEPFILYVPTTWTDNCASGISGAYYMSKVEDGAVSARFYTPEDNNMTVEQYMDACVASLSAAYASDEFKLIEKNKSGFLGGEGSLTFKYSFKMGETVIVATQTTVKKGADMISLYTYCAEQNSEARAEDFDKIKQNFRFAERSDAAVAPNTKGAPDGMQLASSDTLEYKFYAPLSWVCNANSTVSEAYYPESGRPTVTVTSYVPDGSSSIDDYFKQLEVKLISEFREGYVLLSSEPEKREVGGKTANSYTYSVTVEGKTVKVMQTIFVFDSSFYSVTYTALEGSFDTHIGDVEKMLDAISFS